MTINNKYYFLSLDLFLVFRIYIYVVLISTFILAMFAISIWYAIMIPSIFLLLLLSICSGNISIDSLTNELRVNRVFNSIRISYPVTYEYWWSYNFHSGTLEYVSDMERRSQAKSNKVLANFVLKNNSTRIAFKETISLDTRHPNDAKYIQKSIENCSAIITIQRVDKLMLFIEANLKDGRFAIDETYMK